MTGIAYGANGAYFHSGDFYNDMPVYTLDHAGTTWSLYQRHNGRWYIDYNDLSEDWDGTVAIGAVGDFPWSGDWNEPTSQAASPVDKVVIGGAVYSSSTTGTYTWAGSVYNGKPVFEHVAGNTTWSVYQRQDGKWYLDFDEVDEQWSGTVAHTAVAAEFPYEGAWNSATMAVSATDSIAITGAVYASSTTGAYSFDGQTTYNGSPVYTRIDGGTTWSVYQRQDGKWYLDFDEVDEQWSGTVAYSNATDAPWTATWTDKTMIVTDSARAAVPLRGRYDYGTFAGGTDCRDIDFAAPFASDDVRLQLSIDHASSPGIHDAATVWAEAVDRYGARICVRETSNFDGEHDENLSVSYLAHRPGAVIDGESGRLEDSDGFIGFDNQCTTVNFDAAFAVAPIVQATVTHPDQTSGNHDAISVWLEAVTTSSFTVCVRETADMGSDRSDYSVDWLAHEPGAWAFYGADESGVDNLPAFEGSACTSYAFASPFTNTPEVFVTADHRDNGGNHDATTVWLEALSTTGFTACVRELANPGSPASNPTAAHNADLQLAWTAIGDRR